MRNNIDVTETRAVSQESRVTKAPPSPSPAVKHRGRGWKWFVLGVVALACLGAAWLLLPRDGTERAKAKKEKAASVSLPRVEVAAPAPRGLGRVVLQPGIARAFDKADLYAKVSGYLVRQKVDIGDRVKQGDVLAEIDVPELFKSRDQARAALDQARARLKFAQAKLLTVQADRQTAAAGVLEAEASAAKFTAAREFRRKERDRIADLVKRNAVEQELLDEQVKQYEEAVDAERTGAAAVATAKATLEAAEAKISQTRAEVDQSTADVSAAEADLAKAEVFVAYTKITSPYDGVITQRNFHNGDFIRSATEGGGVPLLSVDRIDVMRVVVMVPDLDVPYVDRGDPAQITFDALRDKVFHGKVARFANSETDLKLMRTEVDLPNPKGELRDGMYGTASLQVEPPSNNLTIPSTCLIEKNNQGEGAVYVVRDGKIHRQAVHVGGDNGRETEIVSGLAPTDSVVVRYSGTIADGLAVEATPAQAAGAPEPSQPQ